ncbi:TIR domain-containing protein [Levilactobacillus namurensis]|uniref:TIR domain-containing protein n=1 Tax=Levilactobacillus namurensis TaxID=380393 RepID=UPI0004633DE9|nr:TIR domain-containing protein [Levilactobacillus namurensis]
MSPLLISYQASDPLAQSFKLHIQGLTEDNWDFPAIAFSPVPVKIAFKGRSANRWRRQQRRKIRQARQVLIVISQNTWQSEWVDWEIATAAAEDKQLLAAKLDAPFMAPLALVEAQPQWIDPFDPQALSLRHI